MQRALGALVLAGCLAFGSGCNKVSSASSSESGASPDPKSKVDPSQVKSNPGDPLGGQVKK
jgi:hypothetical protein